MQTIPINESSATQRRILFIAELSAARNEVQRVDLGDISTADTFTLTFSGQTTETITFNATPATFATSIQTALEALSNIAPGEATVAHVTGNIFTVTFSGALAATDVALIVINVLSSSFTAGLVTALEGGILGAPARGNVFVNADLLLSKNGGALTTSAGTFVEVGEGVYYYIAAAAEVDTLGPLVGVLLVSGVAVRYPLVQVVAASVSGNVQRTGTAQGGTVNSITLDAAASSTSNYYTPCLVEITSGTGASQGGHLAYAYNGATKVLSVEPDFVVTPDATSIFRTTAVAPTMADLLRTNHTLLGTFGGDVADVSDIVDEMVARGDEIATEFMDLANGVEASLTLRQALRLIVAASAGKLSGGATTTVSIRNVGDTKTRITATVDADGNRSAITTDLT